MPAIVDHDGQTNRYRCSNRARSCWYLAEKTGRFLPDRYALGRKEALEWLFWQVGNQGPMAGQLSHFVNYAQEGEKDAYAPTTAMPDEYDRCLGVLERRLDGRDLHLGRLLASPT